MGMAMAARPPVSAGTALGRCASVWRSSRRWLSHARSAPHRRPRTRARCWSSPARQERPNAATATAASALQAAGTAGDYTVDVTSDATTDQRRRTSPAIARSCSSTRPATCSAPRRKPTCRPTSRTAAASSASARRPSSKRATPFFDTLIGLTGAPRTTAASAVSTQDVEFLDRVHPATRDLPRSSRAAPTTTTSGPTTRRARSTPSRASASTDPGHRRSNPATVCASVTNDAVHALHGQRQHAPAAARARAVLVP